MNTKVMEAPHLLIRRDGLAGDGCSYLSEYESIPETAILARDESRPWGHQITQGARAKTADDYWLQQRIYYKINLQSIQNK